MPEEIKSKYQYFTEADTTKIKLTGYDKKIMNLREGVGDYIKNYLLKNQYLGLTSE